MTIAHPVSAKRRRIAVLSLALGACTVVSEPASSPAPVSAPVRETPFREDCGRHLQAAMAALAAPTDTTPGATPAGHVHGVAMHEYHMCLGRAAATQTTPRAR